MASTAPRALARVEHSEALLAAIRLQVEALGLSHEMLDHLTGLASGYSGKLLANPPIKRLGNLSLFLILEAIGLDIVLVENPQRLERLRNLKHPQRRQIVLRRPRIQIFRQDFLRLNGSKGGRARAAKLSAKRLSAIARRANRIRWAKHRRNIQAAAATASQSAIASP